MAATAAAKLASGLLSSPYTQHHRRKLPLLPFHHQYCQPGKHVTLALRRNGITCKAADVSSSGVSEDTRNWIPVVPVSALPKGERRVIIQNGEEILLLWYKDEVFAIENRSPAEGAYSEGLINAKLTQEGCIVCPATDSTFDLRNGSIKDWFPKNPVLRVLTPALKIVFSGKAQPGITATDVNVDEVRMVVDEGSGGFGFTNKNELINGKAAIIGFLLLLDFELLTGKGILKGTGFLDFLYSTIK
ncbi:unnamed protein product [Lactuca saligna]|uniref:Rieske domain-containing protein n=1 Tax=Lactuca saligna TaxID=75948 RepID=A0AA35VQ61_LACSI|nr:unnamed protein product [Lactuca saligna]